ncbi:unnamed protein product [Adineta ricciae]|uniref:Uncharacterized protein n=1 Tax=Adineta ricciae TaxID=249248 RepID=A0A814YRY1_ADIRI|nr:unnamed protein product [Adineta ricciae]
MHYYYSPSLPIYSDFFLQRRNQYQDKSSYRQNSYSSPYYPIQSYSQINNYPWNIFSQYERYNTGFIQSSPIDSRYQYQYPSPYHNQIHEGYPRRSYDNISLLTYSRLFYSNDYQNEIYQYNKRSSSHRPPTKKDAKISIPNRRARTEEHPNLPRFPCTLSNISNYANLNPLPPKIRVIFIPPSISLPQQQQQLCNLTPCIPPFLFNRISQPQCSLPLPPPLPQLSSLPLPPAVQQMVMQQYSNPVAILPFAANYFTPSAVPQQPPSIMPAPALPTPQCAVQPSAVPVLPPTNIPMALSNPPAPYAYANPNVFASQPTSGDYPSTCRACVPAPPPLTVPVTGHCWVQHCSACHHVPTDVSNPNERPHNHGRMTPLLRQPTVEQYIYDERNQQYHHQQQQSPQQHYPHINPQARLNSWSNNLPPLPPGAVIISDEYITEDQPYGTYSSSNPYTQYSQHRSNQDNQNCVSGSRGPYTDSSYSSESSNSSCSTGSSSSSSSYSRSSSRIKYNRGSTTTVDSCIHQPNRVHTSRWDAHNNLKSELVSQNDKVCQVLSNYGISSKRKERGSGQIKPSVTFNNQNRTNLKVSASSLNTLDSPDFLPTCVSNQRPLDAISMTTITTED